MRRNRFLSQLIFLAVLAALLSCPLGCKGLTRNLLVANVGPTITRVCDRHDAYVTADTTVKVSDAVADSAQVRAAIKDQEIVAAAVIEVPLDNVMARHDAYVTRDAQLTDLQRRVNLRDTALLRKALAEAGRPPATQP